MADEFEVMKSFSEMMTALADEEAQSRVLAWITAKYRPFQSQSSTPTAADKYSAQPGPVDGEIPGIAKLGTSGELLWTIRDVKAKSANDAAIRLTHVAIWAAGKLTGSSTVSSKSVLVPLLKKWRIYDGNTRGALARERGIVRSGDEVSLDFHALQLAETYIAEILDSSIEGKWRPGTVRRRTSPGRSYHQLEASND